MEQKMHKTSEIGQTFTLRDLLPLFSMFGVIASVVVIHQMYYGWQLLAAMRIMMAAFFVLFWVFKIVNLAGFVQAYRIYDLIAQRVEWYAWVYPFVELGLGMAYLANWQPRLINSITVGIMLISAAGVCNELRKGKQITCACLGAVFRVPMTYVTLAEDLLMAVMAGYMLW